ncbi:MAG: hypothetical protein IH597_15830 [Bacteroidales bacterium]|nr:hypothetical protein [Bacteroidales bacterium]
MKVNSFILWTLTIILTTTTFIYQRRTGPTKPVRGKVEIAGETIKYRLIRTHETGADAAIWVKVENPEIGGALKYRRYKSYDAWSEVPMVRAGDSLVAYIPEQPSAGKVMYDVFLVHNLKRTQLNAEHVVMRYKGAVPKGILIPHVLCMIFAMIFSMRTGFEALFRRQNTYQLAWLTVIFLFFGGIVLGPFVQKFAFGAYWTGWPFGTDLTDNKTAVSFIFWLIALYRLYKNRAERLWVIIAFVVLLAVYMIPHSMLGSEIDHTLVE